jgi:hypothetical protein
VRSGRCIRRARRNAGFAEESQATARSVCVCVWGVWAQRVRYGCTSNAPTSQMESARTARSACGVETLGRCEIALRPVERDAEYANTVPAVAKKADCPIRFCCVDARSVGRFAGIFRAPAAVRTVHGREDTHPVHVVARVIGAFVAVVAHDAFTKVLSAHAGYTDARNTVPVAGSSIGSPDSRPPVTGTSTAKAMTRIAFVPAVLTAPAFRLRVAAPNDRHDAQRQCIPSAELGYKRALS